MAETLAGFKYIHLDQGVKKYLFLLHGTGGNETDLLPLVGKLKTKYNLVGLRGNVSEQGMLRFFSRTAPGVFDETSIKTETAKLAKFLEAW